MHITETELFEYLKCPIRYNTVKKNGEVDIKKSSMKLATLALNQWISASCNGLKADSNVLKSKWDKLSEKNKYDLTARKIIETWGLLYSTYRYITNYNIKFMDVNMSYNIEMPGTGVTLTGNLPPLIDKGSYIEIFITTFDRVLPDRTEIDSKLKHTIDAYAIKNMFNKDVVITYFCPAQGTSIQSLRSQRDFDRLESILKMVSFCIDNDIIYPRETFLCKSCSLRNICKSWTGKE